LTDEACMRRALELAKQSAGEGEVPVGAVLTKDGEIVAEGRNRRETQKNALCHAEIEAIGRGCRVLGGWRLWQCTLYVTLEPCPMCAGAVLNAHIPRVVYGAKDPKAGACGSAVNLLALPGGFCPQVEQGLLQEECAEVLRGFFRRMRAQRKAVKKAAAQRL
jgi:tRNA(adenine34) deaminase